MSTIKRDTKNDPECVETEIWLSVKVDGERVPELKAVLLERHLAACPSCRRAFVVEARRTDLLRGALARGREISGARFVDSLREAREAHPVAPRLVWARRWSLSAAAAIFVGVLLGILVPALRDKPGAGNANEGRNPTASTLPVSDHANHLAGGYNIVLELESEGAKVVPARDGAPLRQDTVRQVRFRLDPFGADQGDPALRPMSPERGRSRRAVGIERVDTRYTTLTSYPYQ